MSTTPTPAPAGAGWVRVSAASTTVWTFRRIRSLWLWALVLLACPGLDVRADYASPRNVIDVRFIQTAADITMPNPTDSNSPAIWIGDDFYIFNSIDGAPRRARGTSIETAQDLNPAGESFHYKQDIGSGRWLEAVIEDESTGNLYGYYHNEIPAQCPIGVRFYPRIGAVMSTDGGSQWNELSYGGDAAIILSGRDGTVGDCQTEHPATIGGVGDFSAILDNNTDPANHYLYFLFSNYGGTVDEQGISFGRMLWTDRDQPLDRFTGRSRVQKWFNGRWSEPGIGGSSTPVFPSHDKKTWTSAGNNGYWGPSIHWNVDLHRFFVLFNHSIGGNYDTEGIYQSYTTDLSNPRLWALPKKIQIPYTQGWYPQVIGDPAIRGTDKLAGSRARYFNAGHSFGYLEFRDNTPPARALSPLAVDHSSAISPLPQLSHLNRAFRCAWRDVSRPHT